MHINPRLLRAAADQLFAEQFGQNPGAFIPGTREWARHQHILTVATKLFALNGRHTISFSAMASALRISTRTLRIHFVDLDSLLAEILHQHLHQIARAIGEIPAQDPSRAQKARDIYYNLSHTPSGALTQPHQLLIQQAHALPSDLSPAIEDIRTELAHILNPTHPAAATALLDSPYIALETIETMLASLTPQAAQPAPQPAETPTSPLTRPTAKNFRRLWPLRPRPSALPSHPPHPPDAWAIAPTPHPPARPPP